MRLLFTLASTVLLLGQDFSSLETSKVLNGFQFTSAPAWSPEGFLLFADVRANQILEWRPGGKPSVLLEDAQGASGAALDSHGRLIVCEPRAHRVVRIDKKKRIEPLAEKWGGKRLNAPNDVAVRKDGNIYFTDPAFGYQQEARELDFYGIYRITPKGDLDVIAKWQTRPNGIAVSSNGRTLFVADSDRRTIRAWELDRVGVASNERAAVVSTSGVPNGLCLDGDGNLYVAARKLEIYSPAGKRIRDVGFAANVTACTFAEEAEDSLFLTAGDTIYRIRLKEKGASQH